MEINNSMLWNLTVQANDALNNNEDMKVVVGYAVQNECFRMIVEIKLYNSRSYMIDFEQPIFVVLDETSLSTMFIRLLNDIQDIVKNGSTNDATDQIRLDEVKLLLEEKQFVSNIRVSY